MKQETRYRITVGDSVHYRDNKPSEDEIERMAYQCQNRGYDMEIALCTTTIHENPFKVYLDDSILYEYKD